MHAVQRDLPQSLMSLTARTAWSARQARTSRLSGRCAAKTSDGSGEVVIALERLAYAQKTWLSCG
jgi:hypothetical protein